MSYNQTQTDSTPYIAHALVVDDDAGLRQTLSMALRREGYKISEAADGVTAFKMAQNTPFDLVITDVRMPGMSGLELLQNLRRICPRTLVIVMTAYDKKELAYDAVREGAYSYFSKPLNLSDLQIIIRHALEKQQLQHKLDSLHLKLIEQNTFPDMVGESQAMQKVYTAVRRVLDNDITVLITGESGTGKEIVARAIHNQSIRNSHDFIAVNCAAIPETLLESELFGHEKGAFTGAVSRRIGKFESANGGTLLLDEIGDMPLSLQAKILRVLQEGEITRIGANKPVKVDVRLIAATNQNLPELVKEGKFRQDLYYRLNAYPITIPPLRDRDGDLPLLIKYFVNKANSAFGRDCIGFTSEALTCIENYLWPGNIRELQNAIQRAVLLADKPLAGVQTLIEDIQMAPPRPKQKRTPAAAAVAINPAVPISENDTQDINAIHDKLDEIFLNENLKFQQKVDAFKEVLEQYLIRQALLECDSQREKTANLLGVTRKTLYSKIKQYHIDPNIDSEEE